jgi:hypothetical protein
MFVLAPDPVFSNLPIKTVIPAIVAFAGIVLKL